MEFCGRCGVPLPDGAHVTSFDFQTQIRERLCYPCYSVLMQARVAARIVVLARDNYISSHLTRARKLDLPATLSLEQWRGTKAHFNHMCAYCQKNPVEVLEHFVPLALGLGTIWSNCVPSCKVCNRRKNNLHPALVKLIPHEDIERVREYLMSLENWL